MPIYYAESRQEIVDKMQADLRAQLGFLNFLRANLITAITISNAGRHYENSEQIKALENMLFFDTALGSFATRWGSFKNITRLPPTQASGLVNATGTLGETIPANSILTSANGKEYKTQDEKIITEFVLSIDSLTRSGATATATFLSDHHIASGSTVVIAGADQSEYNGTYVVTALSAKSLTYDITGSPATPATGTITLTQDFAQLSVLSTDFDSETNFASGSQLSFQTPIAGIDDVVLVQYDGITGGTDEEDDISFKNRYIKAYREPPANFSPYQIEQAVLTVPDITKVWVKKTTPDVGDVTIYSIAGGRDNIIPTTTDLEREAQLLAAYYTPATSEDANVYVLAPSPKATNFNFASLTPNTESMQDAIAQNLKAYFLEDANVGQGLTSTSYHAAVFNTVDPSNGQRIETFKLTDPLGDLIVNENELLTLGDITYPAS